MAKADKQSCMAPQDIAAADWKSVEGDESASADRRNGDHAVSWPWQTSKAPMQRLGERRPRNWLILRNAASCIFGSNDGSSSEALRHAAIQGFSAA